MIKIIGKEFIEHKKLILIYVSICMVLSVLVSPFFTPDDIFNVGAVDIDAVTEAGEMLTEGETLLSLTQMFTKPAIKKLAGSYSSVVGVSCEPFTALLFLGVVENVNKWCGSPLEIASTPAANPIVLIVVLIFFIASKLMKSNEATKVLGLCTLGELEKYLGLVFILVIGVINVVGITDVFTTNTVAAAVTIPNPNSNIFIGIFSAVFSIFMSVASVIVFFIVKTVMFGIDAIQACFSFVPGSGFVFEFLQSIFVCVLLTVNVLFPWVGVAVNALVFIICCFCFRMCYVAEEYVRKIYIKPFFAGINGYNVEFPLVSRKLPKKIRKIYEEKDVPIVLAIPGYAVKKKETESFKLKFFTKVWIVSDGNENIVFARKRAISGKFNELVLQNKEIKPVYIKKSFRYLEIYSVPNAETRKKKDFKIVFSKEYQARLDTIVSIFKFEDYNLIKAQEKLAKKELKSEKKELRRERREMRMESILQKEEEVVNWVKNLFNKNKENI